MLGIAAQDLNGSPTKLPGTLMARWFALTMVDVHPSLISQPRSWWTCGSLGLKRILVEKKSTTIAIPWPANMTFACMKWDGGSLQVVLGDGFFLNQLLVKGSQHSMPPKATPSQIKYIHWSIDLDNSCLHKHFSDISLLLHWVPCIFLPRCQDWFRFYKWDGESTYPCPGSGSCLTSDDRYLDGNNPCDGQPMVGTWKGKGACTASCRWAPLAGLNRTLILRWASWSSTNAVKMVGGSKKTYAGETSKSTTASAESFC